MSAGEQLTQLVEAAAGVVIALTVLGSAAWWLLAPRVRDFVRTVSTTAAELQHNGGESTKDHAKRAADAAELLMPRIDQVEQLVDVAAARLDSLDARLDTVAAVVDETREQLRDHLRPPELVVRVEPGAAVSPGAAGRRGRRSEDR